MKDLNKIITFCLEGIDNSKEGLTTYADDCEADHDDGQQVGREAAYKRVIKECAGIIFDKCGGV